MRIVVCALIFSSPFAFLLSGTNTPFDSAFLKARRVHEISLQLIKMPVEPYRLGESAFCVYQ
jgi:hypothetical protein